MTHKQLNIEKIQDRIFTIRGVQVMIDRDLAEMYQVEVKRLNEQVKRNSERFPESFRFQLNDQERDKLVANCDRFVSLKHSSQNPHAFTEQGVAMLSAVLRSATAILVSINIIEAFVQLRKFITINAGLFQRMDNMEQRQFQFQVATYQRFEQVFKVELKEKKESLNLHQEIKWTNSPQRKGGECHINTGSLHQRILI
ncbi:MAG: ORF6N domain-containing protein [Bacteroidales bacterium]|nr:ORF6N domain-containing protein [Bacteroidales bacterium]